MPSIKTAVWTAVCFVVGLFLFVWLNWMPPGEQQQNPVDPAKAIGKAAAEAKAIDFLREQIGPADWTAFTSYDAFVDALGYMAREKLENEFDEFWGEIVPGDFYRVKVKSDERDERYDVLVKLADGAVFGYDLLISQEDAEDFLEWDDVGETSGTSEVSEPTYAEEQATAASMIGHLGFDTRQFIAEEHPFKEAFIFRHKHQIGEASLSINVRLAEGHVVSIEPIFDLPVDYMDWKTSQDRKGAMWSSIFFMLWALLGLAAIVYMAVYRATMSFRRGILLTLAFLIPYAIFNVNMYPGLRLTDLGDQDYAYLMLVLFSQLITILMAASVYLCLVAGDGLWRKMGYRLWPSHRDMGFASTVMRGVGIGYVFTVILLGLQTTLFYLAGELFDVWFGADPMQSSHNLLWPSLFPLLAWSAAISEEAVFRIFGIALFAMLLRPLWRYVHRLTGQSIWLHPLFYLLPAIFLASLLWALGHTSYSIYPVYTRLVEVTIIGFVFAYIFFRYGLIAAIFTHATLDLVIMSLDLMSSGSRYIPIGFLYMLMPLAVGILIKLLVRPRPQRTS